MTPTEGAEAPPNDNGHVAWVAASADRGIFKMEKKKFNRNKENTFHISILTEICDDDWVSRGSRNHRSWCS